MHATARRVSFTVETPPSVNNLYVNRRGGGRSKSPEYRRYAETKAMYDAATTPESKQYARSLPYGALVEQHVFALVAEEMGIGG